MKDLLAKPKPSIYEMFVVITIALLFTLFIGIFDATLFDGYVRPDIVTCYDENLSPECIAIWENLDCPVGSQDCISKNYHTILEDTIIIVAGMFIAMRLLFGKLAGAKWSTMLIFISIMWGVSVAMLFYFGWIDTIYYEARGIDVPDTLAWLNHIGFLQLLQFYGDTPDVDKEELFLLNAIGIFLLVGIWLKLIYLHKKKHLRKLGIHH